MNGKGLRFRNVGYDTVGSKHVSHYFIPVAGWPAPLITVGVEMSFREPGEMELCCWRGPRFFKAFHHRSVRLRDNGIGKFPRS